MKKFNVTFKRFTKKFDKKRFHGFERVKTIVVLHFWVSKSDFINIKLILWTKTQFLQ